MLQNLTKTNNDDGSVTLKWNLINEGMIEYIKYIVEYGDKKFILLASQKEFRISAGYERIKLSVKVSKNALQEKDRFLSDTIGMSMNI